MSENEKIRRVISLTTGNSLKNGFMIQFPDGEMWNPVPDSVPGFTLKLKSAGSLKNTIFPPTELNVTEAYLFDEFDIEGDLFSVFETAYELSGVKRGHSENLSLLLKILSLPSSPRKKEKNFARRMSGQAHSLERDKDAVSYHYDMSNDLYKLWLDPQMVYSCAYFKTQDTPLEEAQTDKLDYICRKLALKEGEKLLDVGCGWGALVIHAAQNYGVTALGVTLSKNQAELANSRIQQLGLTQRCRVEVRDIREMENEQFDKISSVEMLHHIGYNSLPQYFEKIRQLLKPGGLSFQLAVTSNAAKGKYRGPLFAPKYFMPDYELSPVGEYLKIAERGGFEVYDLENLRQHYMLTARHWLKNIENGHDEIAGVTGEVMYRVYRLSMALMAYGFNSNMINLYHFVLRKTEGKGNYPPLTRWY
ncbi:MAG: cyclopropane-fatty-acyl-phospholipid synthase family protein [Bacteroidetes bacterium]|nr:cyclopropane-fatty-acyl-phospholipid synthase family protein [Bacteroidota bacterium]